MSTHRLDTGLRQVRRLLTDRHIRGLSDADLLGRFCETGDEAAFEVLVWRHGPMVLRHCRRLLRHTQDAEDAFQATFFTLARKANSIRRADQLNSWLYRVAYRIALEARTRAARRDKHERPGLADAAAPSDDTACEELCLALDQEIDGLPEKYRLPVLLCYLQGCTVTEAARQLMCPQGTVMTRPAWARKRLQTRLTRRGLTLTGGLAAAALAGETLAAVPEALTQTTIVTALSETAGAASASAAILAQGVMKAMLWTKVKMATVALAAVVVVSVGGLFGYRTVLAQQTQDHARPNGLAVQPPHPRLDDEKRVQDDLKRGQLQFRLTEVERQIKVLDQQKSQLAKERAELQAKLRQSLLVAPPAPVNRRLIELATPMEGIMAAIGQSWKSGDHVKEGQLLARVDDRPARAEFTIKKAQVEARKAEVRAAELTRDEAKHRYERRLASVKLGAGQITEEDVRGAKLTWERMAAEVVSKKAEVRVSGNGT